MLKTLKSDDYTGVVCSILDLNPYLATYSIIKMIGPIFWPLIIKERKKVGQYHWGQNIYSDYRYFVEEQLTPIPWDFVESVREAHGYPSEDDRMAKAYSFVWTKPDELRLRCQACGDRERLMGTWREGIYCKECSDEIYMGVVVNQNTHFLGGRKGQLFGDPSPGADNMVRTIEDTRRCF
jgi:hypothetical protein